MGSAYVTFSGHEVVSARGVGGSDVRDEERLRLRRELRTPWKMYRGATPECRRFLPPGSCHELMQPRL